MMQRKRLHLTGRIWATVLVASVLSACGAQVEPVQSPVELPDSLGPDGQDYPQRWWTALGDEQLNSLMEQALVDNMSVRMAWDRLAQARALVVSRSTPLYPAVDVTGSASRRVSDIEPAGRSYQTTLSLGLAASYEVDLWGRVRSSALAAEFDRAASAQQLQAAGITLSSQIASAWYRLVELREQLKLLDQQVDTNRDLLEIIAERFRRGQVRAPDVLQQRQVLERTRGERVLVASSVEVQENALAILLGRAPQGFSAPDQTDLPALPALPEVGLPAEWIRARPDVRAAELQVAAADRRTAVAIAEQFPRLTLSANAETSAERFSDLFDNWVASLAGDLIGPVFDAGQREAEVAYRRAVAAERLHEYGRTILTALGEVDDALVEEHSQRAYLASLNKQLKLSDQSLQEVRAGYIKGTQDFIRFLDALLSYQRLQRTVLQARRELVTSRVRLYVAIGRGWEMPAPPLPPRRVIGPFEALGGKGDPLPAAEQNTEDAS
ncbi:MAG: efflux transporter outer membrane subunit [Phycisphaerae bacterium]